MKKTIITVFTLLLLFTMTGCNKGVQSPEEIGEVHFKLYFDILSAEEVDVTKQCELIYATDFVDYCENTMAELDEMLEIRTLTKDDYELYEITSKIMEDTIKELRGFTDYDEVHEVTITYAITLPVGDETTWYDDEYAMFVVEIDGQYKAVMPPALY
mgnify:CR=1 FL=1